MGKIFKYLKSSWTSVIAIVILLVAQAYCDLQLPQYTSDIVDVGIGRGGIAYTAPEKMRGETYENLLLLLTKDEQRTLTESYEEDTDGNYVLKAKDRNTLETIDAELGLPLVLLSALESGQAEYNVETLRMMVEGGMLTEEQLLQIREQALAGMGDLSDSIVTARAAQLVQEEYEALGMDTGKVQTAYLWTVGLKMLALSVLMMVTAILTGLLAARTAAKSAVICAEGCTSAWYPSRARRWTAFPRHP